MSDTGLFFINRLTAPEIGIVSPAYPVFEIISDDLLPEYLELFFRSTNFQHQISTESTGSTRLALKYNKLCDLEINVPSLCVQSEIVNNINVITNVIDLEKKQLKLYDELIKSRFIEMFGDPKTQEKETGTVEISTVCMLKAGKFVKAADIKDTCKDGMYPCYGANGFRGYVKTFNHDGIYNLIGRQGALCGNVTLVSGKFHATEHAVVVTPLQKLDPYWLYYFLMLLDINRYATGAAQPGLAVSTIEKILVKIPDLGLQEAFGNFFKTIDKSKFINYSRYFLWEFLTLFSSTIAYSSVVSILA